MNNESLKALPESELFKNANDTAAHLAGLERTDLAIAQMRFWHAKQYYMLPKEETEASKQHGFRSDDFTQCLEDIDDAYAHILSLGKALKGGEEE